MKKWQYFDHKIIYSAIGLMNLGLSLRHLMTPLHLTHTNPSLPYGGMAIGSKFVVLEHFKDTKQFLDQTLIKKNQPLKVKLRKTRKFLKNNDFPIIAKPDYGSVGRGVLKIRSFKQLKKLLANLPDDYVLQEYCDLPHEYGVFFYKLPGDEKGQIVSLTEKQIPSVIGDGASTIRELILKNRQFDNNKPALLNHVPNLYRIPKKREHVILIVQGSHTFGSKFIDRCGDITPQLTKWVNSLCSVKKDFYYGRFDIKAESLSSFNTGKGIKIIELNGCMSEPIHIYDDRHTFTYAMKTIFKSYSRAYKIAKRNMKNKKATIPYLKIIKEFKKLRALRPELIRLSTKGV